MDHIKSHMQVVKETLRLFPVVATGTARVVDEPMRLGDIYIPKGAVFTMPQYAIQRSARYFKQPDNFLPERWLPPASSSEDDKGRAMSLCEQLALPCLLRACSIHL